MQTNEFIDDLELSTRAQRALVLLGVTDRESFLALDPIAVKRVKNIGRVTENEIRDAQSAMVGGRGSYDRTLMATVTMLNNLMGDPRFDGYRLYQNRDYGIFELYRKVGA